MQMCFPINHPTKLYLILKTVITQLVLASYKVNNRRTRTGYELYSTLIMERSERHSYEHFLRLVVLFLLLTLNM